jgi:ribonuclease E
MELSRQRLQTSLGETSHMSCPRCHGIGHIRSVESSALHILRILQEEAMKENTAAVHAQVPVDVATFLLNEKRSEFHEIEQRLKVNMALIPNIHLETPAYTVTRLRHDELNQMEPLPASYRMVDQPAEAEKALAPGQEAKPMRPQAAVQGITPEQPAPVPVEPVAPPKPSILQKIFGWLTRAPEAKPEPVQTRPREVRRPPRDGGRRERRGGGRDEAQASRRAGAGEGQQRPPQQRRDRGGQSDRGERGSERPSGRRPLPEAAIRGEASAPAEQRGIQERRERPERAERTERPERPVRPERSDRPERVERQERPPRPERPRMDGEGGSGDGEGRGRRRRGRRGRGDGEGRHESRPDEGVGAGLAGAATGGVSTLGPVSSDVTAHSGHEAAPAADQPGSEGRAAGQIVERTAELATRVDQAVVAAEAAPASAAPVTTPAAAAPAHPREEPAAMPEYRAPAPAPTYSLPPDMVQVETTHAAPPLSEPEPELTQPRRPRRPAAEPPVETGPLVQVETRHESSE